ncbi:MAG: metallophosphoesterase family protein [Spirosomataceae bacterium]
MQHILIISDTHHHLDARLQPHIDWCDQIWHAGDWGTITVSSILTHQKPVRGVYGNIDGQDIRIVYPKILHFECEQLHVGMTHIAGTPGRYKPDAKQLFAEKIPDIFVCGHSHILRVERDATLNNMLFINPGAAGKEGFHKIQTALRLKIDGKRVFDVEVIEIGKRGSLL